MRLFLTLLFISISLFVFSQAAKPSEKIKISKSQFAKAKTLHELIPSLPKKCPVEGYLFAIDTPQLKKTLSMKGEKITGDLKSIVKGMKAGQKFYFENIKSNCKIPFKSKHIFIIT